MKSGIDAYLDFCELIETERKKQPGLFLFNSDDIELMNKAELLIMQSNEPFFMMSLDDEKAALLKTKCLESFKKEHISIKKLKAMIEKIKTSFYWSIEPDVEQITDKNGVVVDLTSNNYKVIISTQEENQNISLSENHPFFEAQTIKECLSALKLSDLYLYVSFFERVIIKNFEFILENSEENSEESELLLLNNEDKFFYYPSSIITNAYHNVGANARKPKITKGRNEKGQQIIIAEYSSHGFVLEEIIKPNQFFSVGDPNTDKLLLQAQIITMQTKQKKFTIDLDDFMTFRGLNDRKSAALQAEEAGENLYNCSLALEEDIDDIKASHRFRYVVESHLYRYQGRGGCKIEFEWAPKFYNHIKNLIDNGQQFEFIDPRVLMIPNNKPIPYNISRRLFDHLRFNIGKKNAHIIGIKTLLESCNTLPLYPETSEDRTKSGFLKYPSEARHHIIKPFLEGLNYLTEEPCHIIESYNFTYKGKPLDNSEVSEVVKDYKRFIACNIEWKFTNEPDYKNLIDKKNEHQEKSKSKKKKHKTNTNLI